MEELASPVIELVGEIVLEGVGEVISFLWTDKAPAPPVEE
jgi:hypothetical protein